MRKKTAEPLTYEDVLKAGEVGDGLFAEWVAQQDKYTCDCESNYGKTCKYPEKYRDGGCD